MFGITEAVILDGDRHQSGTELLFPQPPGDRLRHQQQHRPDLPGSLQIPGTGHRVAHALHFLFGVFQRHRRAVLPVGALPQGIAVLAQLFAQQLPVKPGQLSDGIHPHGFQAPGCGIPHTNHLPGRQPPDNLPEPVRRDLRDRVRFFEVAAQLGKYLIKGDPHRNGHSQFLPHLPAQAFGNLPPAAEQQGAAGHIQPAFIDAEGLDAVGVPGVDGTGCPGYLIVALVVGRHHHQFRTFLPGLPEGFRCLDAELLCQLVFGKHDAMPVLLRTAHCHGHFPQPGIVPAFHRRIEIIEVTVQDHPFLSHEPLPPFRRFVTSIINEHMFFVKAKKLPSGAEKPAGRRGKITVLWLRPGDGPAETGGCT